jgi:transglutaminase-like putative cysteine protease
MKFQLRHTTQYEYAEKVHFSPHHVILRPRENHEIRVLNFSLSTMPSGRITWFRDAQENSIARCTISGESKQMVIHAEMTVQVFQDNPFDFILDPVATQHPFSYDEFDRVNLAPALAPVAEASLVKAWLADALREAEGDTMLLLTRLNKTLFESLTYVRRDEMGIQSPNETLRLRSGSCRDFAFLFMSACRELQIAARFVSGYLYVPSAGLTENRAENAMHAWCEVYLPGAGWKGFDPTHGLLVTNHFIPVAVSAFPETINPIQGSYLHAETISNTLKVEVVIHPVD